MAFLEGFSNEERSLLVSLPYRTGLWVSSCDLNGGSSADNKELDALEKTIQVFAQGMYESALIHEILAETFLQKAEWRNWGRNLAAVPDDCRKAVQILKGKVSPRDVDAFRRILMQIGLEVARAFREYDKNEPWHYRLSRKIGMIVDRFFGAMRGEKYASEDLLNISYEEDIALNKLAMALRGEAEHATENAGIIVNT